MIMCTAQIDVQPEVSWQDSGGRKQLAAGSPLRGGTLQNIKFQAPNLRVSGVRCQERETYKLKPEH
jgi:hypothetical protein